MGEKKKPSAAAELERQQTIRKLVIIAMLSDDNLMERLVVIKRGRSLPSVLWTMSYTKRKR